MSGPLDKNKALTEALHARERACRNALDRLRELASTETENEVHDLTSGLGDLIELTGCLRRLVRGRSVHEIHEAFGAPGDFGYETQLGEALSRIYLEASG